MTTTKEISTIEPSVNRLTNLQQLDRLAHSWNTLQANFASPMQTFFWIKTCAKTIDESTRIEVIYLSSSGTLLALAPLSKPVGFAKCYELFGVGKLFEPTDFLYQNTGALQILTSVLAKRKLAISLNRVPADSPLIESLKKSYYKKAIISYKSAGSCPYINLDPVSNNPENLLSKGLREDIRRARRKAEKIGPIEVKICSPSTPEDYLELYDQFLKIEASGWKGSSNTALEKDILRNAFFKMFGVSASAQGIMRMCFLWIGGNAVAGQIAVQSDGRFWLLKIGYDEHFAKCSPGQLMMLESLRYASAQGLKSYEFLGGSTKWTRRWTKTEREMTQISVYPFTLSAMNAFFWRISADVFHKLLSLFSR